MESAAEEPEQGVWDLCQGMGKDNTWTMMSQSRHISWNHGIILSALEQPGPVGHGRGGTGWASRSFQHKPVWNSGILGLI